MASRDKISHAMRANPLLVVAFGAVFGITLVDLGWVTSVAWLGIAALAAILLALRRPTLLHFIPVAVCLFAALHIIRVQDTFTHPLRVHLLTLPDRPVEVAVVGYLYPWTEGAELDEATAICRVKGLRWGNAGPFEPMSGQIKIALPRGFSLNTAGLYELRGQVSLPKPPMNPGQFDPVDYSLRMGWVAVLRAQRITLKEESVFAPRFHLLYAAENCRRWIMQQLTRGLENEGQHAAVILAMALGASDAAGEDIEDAFRDSGTLHVFAVSGLHVVMLAQIAVWLLRWMGKKRLIIFIVMLVFFYAFITGWRPSAARAAFMISIVMIGPLLYRKARLSNTLGAAALILLLADTHQLFIVGFQLSFGVLLAIALITPLLLETLRPWYELDPFLPHSLANRRQRFRAWSRQWIASLLSVSLAAWAGSLPFMLGHFQTVTPVAIVANLLLVPLSSLCLIFTCMTLAFSALHFSWLVLMVNQLNAWLAWIMVISAGGFAALPGSNFALDLRFQKAPAPVELRVFHISGGGGAGHLRVEDRQWLIDSGALRSWRSVMRPYLRHQGINDIHDIILTHADASHIGAAPLVLRTHATARLHTSQLEPWPTDGSATSFHGLSRSIMPDGSRWQRHSVDDELKIGPADSASTRLTILYPGRQDLHDQADDRALTFMIQVGQMRVLWLSDAGFITEKRLLESQTDLRCDVLIRHQHSNDVTGLTELLIAARPRAVISANDSRFNEEKLPQRLRTYCEAHHVPLFDLEVCGSVGIEFRAAGLEVSAFRSGECLHLPPR